MASSVGGVGTGARADRLLVDDPHHVQDGESPAKLARALLWLHEVLPTRLNDPSRSAIVVIMQRVHERDIAGAILAKELGYEHLMLPMRYGPERHGRTGIGFEDWRTREGELLFPERFPNEVVDRDERVLGSYAVAAQFQQRPAPRGGGLLKVERLAIVADWPRHAATVRVWDMAATAEGAGTDPDYTAGVKMVEQDGRSWIVDVVRGRWSSAEVEAVVAQTAQRDGRNTVIHLKQKPGAAGKSVVDHFTRRVLKGFAVHAARDSGAKVLRAQPFAAAIEAGNVSLVQGAWNEAFLDEARAFPAGAHDDQVDAAADAWLRLSQQPVALIAI